MQPDRQARHIVRERSPVWILAEPFDSLPDATAAGIGQPDRHITGWSAVRACRTSSVGRDIHHSRVAWIGNGRIYPAGGDSSRFPYDGGRLDEAPFLGGRRGMPDNEPSQGRDRDATRPPAS